MSYKDFWNALILHCQCTGDLQVYMDEYICCPRCHWLITKFDYSGNPRVSIEDLICPNCKHNMKEDLE